LGFLPRKSGERRQVLGEVSTQTATLIFFESPHRLRVALADMVVILGADRSIAVCRELTKLYEEIWRGTLAGAQREWAEREPRGEFTLVVAGAVPPSGWDKAQVEASLSEAMAAGATPKDAVRQVTDQSGWPKREVYALVQNIKSERR
jgi:16S rRNA (cytidine1402-2'-O)-methyltransferase